MCATAHVHHFVRLCQECRARNTAGLLFHYTVEPWVARAEPVVAARPEGRALRPSYGGDHLPDLKVGLYVLRTAAITCPT